MSVKILKCFIASPGDTAFERDVCDKVLNEINQGLGSMLNFRVETLRWENDSRPAFGEYSQKVISSQLGNEYELFIGIMHQKFGTPTKVAGSGTEEEFNNAYARFVEKKDLEIMFYFNDASPENLSDINFPELQKVQAFKSKLASLGGYYWTYKGSDKFEEIFRKHLTKYLIEKHDIAGFEYNDSTLKKKAILSKKFDERLNTALSSFEEQPVVWVEPIISATNKISQNPDENYNQRVPIADLVKEPVSTIFLAPPEFGLTSLSHWLIKEAWENGDVWIYIDADKVKPHNIHNALQHELELLGLYGTDVKCIILDSCKAHDTGEVKKIKNLCEAHPDTPIYVMKTIDDSKFLTESDESSEVDRDFEILYLLALPRNHVRKLISVYNKEKCLGEEDIVLRKIVSDLDVLNIHRTPMNCITLLKAAEKKFDESPVNRTSMLENVLFVLFNMDGIPQYKTKPDLKDCEYILGRFCENLIREDFYEFSREIFLKELEAFCTDKFIDVDVDVVFDVLAANNIIIRRNLNYAFRATYWVLYFAAKRMHIDENFCSYIFSSKKYIQFPEIIEFYTGIDRNRTDALITLRKDIANICDTVIGKIGLNQDMNPLGLMNWMPTEAQIEKAQKEIGENVIKSGLPDELKDQHADKTYNQIRPYNQSIQSFFEEYSVYNLMQNIRAASRALRNSDYVDAEIKKGLLNEIFRSWEQMSKILFALTPVLASKGLVNFEGASFTLSGNFGNTYEEKSNRIIQVNPTNVVALFKDDLFSSKIGPLLYEQFKNEDNPLKKHQLALLFIFCRPREWKTHIEEYIVSIPKNSFYLYDTVNNLRSKYRYDFTTEIELREIGYLYQLGLAKHTTGVKKPTMDKVVKIPTPKREFKED